MGARAHNLRDLAPSSVARSRALRSLFLITSPQCSLVYGGVEAKGLVFSCLSLSPSPEPHRHKHHTAGCGGGGGGGGQCSAGAHNLRDLATFSERACGERHNARLLRHTCPAPRGCPNYGRYVCTLIMIYMCGFCDRYVDMWAYTNYHRYVWVL